VEWEVGGHLHRAPLESRRAGTRYVQHPMLEHSNRGGVDVWTSPHGELRIWKPAPHVLVTKFNGESYDFEFAEHVINAVDAMSTQPNKPHVFHDWEGMRAYETKSRTAMTDQSLKYLKQMRFTVFTVSSIVKMGVAMANFVMRGEINIVTNRQDFDAALAKAVREKG
jgi:hypothetical protein